MTLTHSALNILTLEEINNQLIEWGIISYEKKITNYQYNELCKDKLELFDEEDDHDDEEGPVNVLSCTIYYYSRHGHLIVYLHD